jgi:HPt (histidine-containing phosphotransfer) domain-containing protein
MARYSLSGAVDFAYLEQFAAGDPDVVEEVLGSSANRPPCGGPMLDPSEPGWRDAAHTVKGMARGVGAFALGDACEAAERLGLPRRRAAGGWSARSATSPPTSTNRRCAP